MRYKLALIFCFFMHFSFSQGIIPMPNSFKPASGFFKVPDHISLSSTDPGFGSLIPDFSASVSRFSSVNAAAKSKNGTIRLVRNQEIVENEAYRLNIEPQKITIEASNEAGCFYGLQSLVQLIHSANPDKQIQCGTITDQPRYEWRGFMLDESRHFFGMQEVKKILDMMALHKLNKFHWHLTDAQGWRIEIKQYPLLTTVGGKGNNSDPEAEARFYTQEQIAEIVRYAANRFIEVIPEIDMPGHATAAVRAYPEFSGGGSKKYPDFTFNPGKEGTYQFLTNILKEVAELFPSIFIHLGGDEVSFGNQQWKEIPEIQQLMKQEKLENLLSVEHYFLNRMADSVKKIGKTVIGWDEVVTAALPTSTRVMWWRHDQPKMLELALKNGYTTILCPRIPLYFDFVQLDSHKSGRKWGGKFAPIESVYNFPSDQFMGGISIATPLIKGIQANLWSETTHTAERMEFMLFPRMSALAEAGWTCEEKKNFTSYALRMANMAEIYKKSSIHFFDFRNPENSMEITGSEK